MKYRHYTSAFRSSRKNYSPDGRPTKIRLQSRSLDRVNQADLSCRSNPTITSHCVASEAVIIGQTREKNKPGGKTENAKLCKHNPKWDGKKPFETHEFRETRDTLVTTRNSSTSNLKLKSLIEQYHLQQRLPESQIFMRARTKTWNVSTTRETKKYTKLTGKRYKTVAI